MRAKSIVFRLLDLHLPAFRKFCIFTPETEQGLCILHDFAESFRLAFALVVSGDRDLYEIILLSVQVSLTALLASCIIGFALGTLVALTRFPGRGLVIVLFNTFMGLPPVVVGLLVYLTLSRAGPLGTLGLLYTPAAMVIAQTILITPIIAALSRQIVEDLFGEYDELFRSLSVPVHQAMAAVLWDARYSLITVALAGFGRAIAEVGAVMIVGGNIDHLTRVMTTAIALETSKGDLALALALGIVLLAISMAVNAAALSLSSTAARQAYA
ncbi:MAG: ABC transporter permease [Alphaproteobacteria bacterium]|nr:ABC transporter permease [Alphaproteobacteria bacterium]